MHEIAKQVNGSDAFCRTSDSAAAWHEACGIVATIVPAGSSPEVVAKGAGLDAEVVKEETFTRDGKVAGYATIRAADRNVIGSVGADYQIVPMARLVEIASKLQADGIATCDTAMALRNHAVGVLNMRILGATTSAKKGDDVTMNLALCQGFDGRLRVSAIMSATRTVCANTLAVAMGSNKHMWTARHTLNVEEAIKEIETQIATALPAFTTAGEKYKQLAETPFTPEDFVTYARSVFPTIKDPATSTRKPRLLGDLVQRFEAGVGNQGKTAWDGLNAVTEYLTHGKGRTAETRIEALLNGTSADFNATAFTKAVQMSDRILQVVRTDGTLQDVYTAAAEGNTLPSGALLSQLVEDISIG